MNVFSVCSKPPSSGAKELEDYPEIHGLVEKIRKIQSSKTVFVWRGEGEEKGGNENMGVGVRGERMRENKCG